MTTNARSAALGGAPVSISDGDISQFFDNPSTLDSVKVGSIFFNINPFFAGISGYGAAYSFQLNKIGHMAIGLNYLNYGSFILTDPTGRANGNFSANDFIFSIGKSHQLGPVTLGINLKIARSVIEDYSSAIAACDVGGVFRVNKNWTIGMVFSNIGTRISSYSELTDARIPFSVRLGTTFKPEYMPLRFTITTTNLSDKNTVIRRIPGRETSNVPDKIFRRATIGVELLLSPHFHVLAGYNHRLKQEFRLEETAGGAGLSYGLMIGVKRFKFRFSRTIYHAAGASSFIDIQTNTNGFKKIL